MKFTDSDPDADPQQALVDAHAELVALGFFEAVEPTPVFPLTTQRTAEILSFFGYDVDGLGLVDLVDRGLLDRPGDGENGLEWSPLDFKEALTLLTYRKQYRPSAHDADKNFVQVRLERARAAGTVAALAEYFDDRPDVRQCLAGLVNEADQAIRDRMASMLRYVLEIEHGLVV
jgi:hypothetical protein